MLALFDASALSGVLKDEPDLRAAFVKGYHAPSTFVTEGLGDYGFYYQGFYPRWGLLGPPEPLARLLRASRKLPSLRALLGLGAFDHAAEHKVSSLAAATLLAYLLETRGADAVRSWLLDPAGVETAFAARLGVSVADAERGWLAWLDRAAASQNPDAAAGRIPEILGRHR